MGAWFVWMLTFIDLYGGGRKPWLLLRLEREEEVGSVREKGGGEEEEIFDK